MLSEPVAASPSRAFQLVPHGLGERAAALSFGLGGVLGPTRCDVSADPAIGQGAEVGLAAVTGIGGSFLGLAAKVLFDPVHERNELVLIAHALRQAMRHDDLGVASTAACAL